MRHQRAIYRECIMTVSVSRRVLVASCAAIATRLCYGNDWGFGSDMMFLNRRSCNRCQAPRLGNTDAPFSEPVMSSGTVTEAEATPPVTAPTESTLSSPRRTRVFRFRPESLVNGPCTVSDLQLVIDESGNWHATLMAIRSAVKTNSAADSAPRSLFRLDLTATLPNAEQFASNEPLFAKPTHRLIARQDFWINRGESRRVSLSGYSEELKLSFEKLDEVSALFSWR
jgi:hypothetical protein